MCVFSTKSKKKKYESDGNILFCTIMFFVLAFSYYSPEVSLQIHVDVNYLGSLKLITKSKHTKFMSNIWKQMGLRLWGMASLKTNN